MRAATQGSSTESRLVAAAGRPARRLACSECFLSVLPGLGCRVASAAAALDQLNGRLDAVLLGQHNGFPYQLEMSRSLFKN